MKKRLITLWALGVLLLSVCGCAAEELTFEKADIVQAPAEVQAFAEEYARERGCYQYTYDANTLYIFINSGDIADSSAPLCITSAYATQEGKEIRIFFEEGTAPNTAGSFPTALYRLLLPQSADTLRIFRNGQETALTVSGG